MFSQCIAESFSDLLMNNTGINKRGQPTICLINRRLPPFNFSELPPASIQQQAAECPDIASDVGSGTWLRNTPESDVKDTPAGKAKLTDDV